MNILYARAWYSKALALLNLKNQIGSGKNFEKTLEAFDAEDNELKVYVLYFMGLFYCRARHFRKAAERLEKCLKLKTPKENVISPLPGPGKSKRI